jgi:hypothetical protein
MKIQAANSPRWTTLERIAIDLVVKFVEIATPLPFTASPDDCTDYGVELFNNAVAGKYGDIAEPAGE